MIPGRNNTKIERHKQDIEKRIQELSDKLKESKHDFKEGNIPVQKQRYDKASYMLAPSKDQPQPYLKQYKGRDEYVQSPEIVRIRNTLKERNYWNNRTDYQTEQKYFHLKNNNQKQRVTLSMMNPRQVEKPISRENNSQNIYDMMSMILKNQQNLQKQVCLLRTQWKNDNNTTKAIVLEEQFAKPNQSRLPAKARFKQDISHDNIIEGNQKNYEIYNLKPNMKKQSQQIQQLKQKNISDGIPERTFQIYQEKKRGTSGIKQQRQNSHKKKQVAYQKNDDHLVELTKIIRNQKSRSERFVVKEQDRGQFWKVVQSRIKLSEKEYKDSSHRNNRHEHEHLINTLQLQKKLKDDLVSKIYGQVNNCIYK